MKNSFTEDQVRQLQANQYTEYVSSKSIRFTDALNTCSAIVMLTVHVLSTSLLNMATIQK
jgi:hypothetical protein